MLLEVYSVFDSKVGAYLPPIFFRSKGEAIRAFSAAASKHDHDFYRYADDYTLFSIGTWDDCSSKFVCFSTPTSIGKASEFLSLSNNANIRQDVHPRDQVDFDKLHDDSALSRMVC